MNVGEAIAKALVAEGVTLAAGISGTHIGKLLDALAGRNELQLMYARQERVAFDICDGFARATGRPAVVFADSGPAAANAMGGLVNSWGDSVPVLFFAGHNDRVETASRQTKEIPFLELFRPVSKWAALVQDPSQVTEIVRRAFMQLRTGRPGPVVIGTPLDVASTEIGDFDYAPVSPALPIRSGADPHAVATAASLIEDAKRPYVYVGAGVLASGATEALVRLAEHRTLPVATTLNGKSAFPENHALSLGIGGFIRATYGSLPASLWAEQADLIVTIGCGFRQHAVRARPTAGVRHIQVDVEPAELNRDHLADVVLLGDAKVVIEQLVSALSPEKNQARLDEIDALKGRWDEVSAPLLRSDEMPINPFRVTAELTRLVDPNETIVLHDAGTVRGTTSQHYLATKPRSFLGFGVQSAMGWSIGAAMGAKKARPEKLVVAVVGEEAFNETALDIETSIRNDAPILVIVKNNRRKVDRDGGSQSERLARVRFHQGVEIGALATALGAGAYRIEKPREIAAGLKAAIAEVKGGRTAVVDVVTTRMNASLHSLWKK
jgi:acetolactate synthase-1/2/3 large subunit